MKGRVSFLASLFLLFQLLSASPQATTPAKAPALPPQEIFKHVSPSVFVIEALDSEGNMVSQGSGVAVGSDKVVTNKHVIDASFKIRVRQGEKTWPATVTHIDAEHDLCSLEVKGLKAPPVQVRPSTDLQVGDRVYAIGAPEGFELTFSEGIISALRDYSGARIIQTTAAISPGSSGGGLFDTQKRLVGITTYNVLEGQSLNFAVPGEWVLALEQNPAAEALAGEASRAEELALAWVIRCTEQGEAGEYKKALIACQEAIRLKPDDEWAWYNLGAAYNHLGQDQEALNPDFRFESRQ